MNEIYKTKKNKQLIINVSPEKHLEIKMAATLRGISIKKLIENAITFYAKNEDNGENYED